MGSWENEGKSSIKNRYDYSFKILLVGDSGVGKSSLLLSFFSNHSLHHELSPTIVDQRDEGINDSATGTIMEQKGKLSWGYHCHFYVPDKITCRRFKDIILNDLNTLSVGESVDFKIKLLSVGGKRLKLTIWDTAGQERFGTLTSSYYRGAHGIILVYDVTRRETFMDLLDVWAKEVELYSTNPDCIRLVVGNKVDRDSERAVTREEGLRLARKYKCSFLECSAKTRENVHECFKGLIFKMLEVPTLLEKGSMATKRQTLKQKQIDHQQFSSSCCS